MAYNTDHLAALTTRLANETARHGNNPSMKVYLEGIKKEIANEEAFLESHGVETYSSKGADMSVDEILSELGL